MKSNPRPPLEQLKRLDARLGKGKGAKKEREKLAKRLAQQEKS